MEKTVIRGQALQSVSEFFGLTINSLKDKTKDEINLLVQKAKLGMSFEREMGVQERSGDKNKLKIITLIAADKNELKKLIKKNMAQYSLA